MIISFALGSGLSFVNVIRLINSPHILRNAPRVESAQNTGHDP